MGTPGPISAGSGRLGPAGRTPAGPAVAAFRSLRTARDRPPRPPRTAGRTGHHRPLAEPSGTGRGDVLAVVARQLLPVRAHQGRTRHPRSAQGRAVGWGRDGSQPATARNGPHFQPPARPARRAAPGLSRNSSASVRAFPSMRRLPNWSPRTDSRTFRMPRACARHVAGDRRSGRDGDAADADDGRARARVGADPAHRPAVSAAGAKGPQRMATITSKQTLAQAAPVSELELEKLLRTDGGQYRRLPPN